MMLRKHQLLAPPLGRSQGGLGVYQLGRKIQKTIRYHFCLSISSNLSKEILEESGLNLESAVIPEFSYSQSIVTSSIPFVFIIFL